MKYYLLLLVFSFSAHASWFNQVGSITQAELATRSTGQVVPAGGVALSPSTGSVNITNSPISVASVTITTTGRPVYIALAGYNISGNTAGVTIFASNTSTDPVGLLTMARSGSSSLTLGTAAYTIIHNGAVAASMTVAPGPVWIDTPVAGTYTYTLTGIATTGTMTVALCMLNVFEL